MSSKGNPPDDSIVAQARSKLAGFFSSTITALSEDMVARLQPPGGPKPSAISKATTELTTTMISLLAARVQDILPDTTPPTPPAPPSGGGTTGGTGTGTGST